MIIKKYGLVLRRLTEKDLELVRIKRNEEKIRKYMFFQEIITPEMQQKWFKTINTIAHYYFLIEYKNEFIGLINGKNLDFEKRTNEGGLFIWEEKYWGTFVPATASIMLADLAFEILKLKAVYAEVKKDNLTAINYNKNLGYEFQSENVDEGKQIYVLTRQSYYKHSERIRKGIAIINEDNRPISINDIDFSTVSEKDKKALYTSFPEDIQAIFNTRL